MKYEQLLKYASIGISARIEREQNIAEELKAQGKPSPITTPHLKQLEIDFETVLELMYMEETGHAR